MATYIGEFIHTLSGNTTLIKVASIYIQTDVFFMILSMLLFTLTLAEQFKQAKQEKEKYQTQLIQQLKENEVLKERSNKNLELKVAQRTAELEERNKQLDAFVYRASHDIKGPLKSILGIVNIAELDESSKQHAQYLHQIKVSVMRLDATIADLLAVARANYSVVNKTDINFSKLIEDIGSLFGNQIEKLKFKLIFENKLSGKIFFSDEKILFSIFQNIIENAIKYYNPSLDEHFVKITIYNEDNFLYVQFDDNGIGIEEKHLQKVFEMFYRATEESTGSGLGLYIVKLSIEKLGGSIHIQSAVRKGTQITLKFAYGIACY